MLALMTTLNTIQKQRQPIVHPNHSTNISVLKDMASHNILKETLSSEVVLSPIKPQLNL